MPILKKNGSVYQFDFDPQQLAEMIYNGDDVYLDEGLAQPEQDIQNLLINKHLKTLWGTQGRRTIPKQKYMPGGPPGIWETEESKDNFPFPAQGNIDYQGVQTDPSINYQINKLDSIPSQSPDFMQVKNTPTTIRMASMGQRGKTSYQTPNFMPVKESPTTIRMLSNMPPKKTIWG